MTDFIALEWTKKQAEQFGLCEVCGDWDGTKCGIPGRECELSKHIDKGGVKRVQKLTSKGR